MKLPLYFLLSLHLHRLTLASYSGAEPQTMFSSTACTDQLLIFSSCLLFIGAHPNNRTDFPPPQCCHDISTAFTNGSAICLCYLILQPNILGFPLNSTNLLSLTSICPRTNHTLEANFSLQKLCSESAATLPPLRSITASNNPMPHHIVAQSPPPQESSGGPSTEEPAEDSPHQDNSSTPSKIRWLRFTVIGSIILFHCYQQSVSILAELI